MGGSDLDPLPWVPHFDSGRQNFQTPAFSPIQLNHKYQHPPPLIQDYTHRTRPPTHPHSHTHAPPPLGHGDHHSDFNPKKTTHTARPSVLPPSPTPSAVRRSAAVRAPCGVSPSPTEIPTIPMVTWTPRRWRCAHWHSVPIQGTVVGENWRFTVFVVTKFLKKSRTCFPLIFHGIDQICAIKINCPIYVCLKY